jgi:hypothetical protein
MRLLRLIQRGGLVLMIFDSLARVLAMLVVPMTCALLQRIWQQQEQLPNQPMSFDPQGNYYLLLLQPSRLRMCLSLMMAMMLMMLMTVCWVFCCWEKLQKLLRLLLLKLLIVIVKVKVMVMRLLLLLLLMLLPRTQGLGR